MNSAVLGERKLNEFLVNLILQVGMFCAFQAGSYVSLLAHRDLSVSDYYIPTSLSIIFINWLSPERVLPVMYLNAVVTSYAWGNSADNVFLWFIFAIPETLYPLISWLLFRRLYKGKPWIPDVENLILFLAAGVLVPAIIETLMFQSILLMSKVHSASTYWSYVSSNFLSEFATTFLLTLPVLYFVTPFLERKGLVRFDGYKQTGYVALSTKQWIEVCLIFGGILMLAYFLNFISFWFVYGFFSLYIAIRFGFGLAIITNLYIISLTYIIPNFIAPLGKNSVENLNDSIEIFLGANFLFVFAAITGRVISDVRKVEKELKDQNDRLAATNQTLERTNAQLEVANQELDRFAYSVSHDLSAPLKTVLGLVAISKLKDDPQDNKNYLDMIGKSVRKLEAFISEVLDYSKNKRHEPTPEQINIRSLVDDTLENINNSSLERRVDVYYDIKQPEVCLDKGRVKIILNNLLSNAIKYQRTYQGHRPLIRIVTNILHDNLIIRIEDNGEGIHPEMQSRIFEMFYRGNYKSQGSGLGLYIAKDAAHKLKGTITVSSIYGQGSTFEVMLPIMPSPIAIKTQ